MSNAKSRYYEAVRDGSATPPSQTLLHTKNGLRFYDQGKWWDGNGVNSVYPPSEWLRPLPPDAVVISGEDIRGLIDLAVRLKGELEYVNGRSKEDRLQPSLNAINVIISILNRSQQKEEK